MNILKNFIMIIKIKKQLIKYDDEKQYLNKIANLSIEKSNKRINNIKLRMINDITKNKINSGRYPYYQINNLFEYNILKKYIEDFTSHYELLWCNITNTNVIMPTQLMNKLEKIIGGRKYCCVDCDYKMKFINKKIYCIYCYLYPIKHII